MKKNISLFLALLMMAGSFASCAESTVSDDSSADNTTAESTLTADAGVTETVPETEERLEPDLPDVTYGGADFRFYAWDLEGWRTWNDIWSEAVNGEPINDAVYERNTKIEDTYEVKISFNYDQYETYEANVRTGVAAGDDAWDVLISQGHCIPRMYQYNVFYNLHDVDYIDFDQPWWDQNCVESFTLGGYLPFVVSDMLVLDKARTAVTFFNKYLVEIHSLENLYDTVREGKWTIDRMIKLGEVAANDVDNDGIATDNDVYGLVCGDDPVHMLFHSAGGRFVTKDEEGYPALSFESEYNFTVIKYFLEELMYKEHLTRNNDFVEGSESVINMFMENQGLFLMHNLAATNDLRAMESDFGILPVPNYSETQKNYSSTVAPLGGNLISVPVTNRVLDMTGVILEALSAESMYTLIPAFYDTVLKQKSARDPDSVEMLDIIIGNMVYDVGTFYSLNSFPDFFLRITGSVSYISPMFPTRTSDIVSFWKQYQKGTENELEKLKEIIDGWNDIKTGQ